jgi:hypothetical protein
MPVCVPRGEQSYTSCEPTASYSYPAPRLIPWLLMSVVAPSADLKLDARPLCYALTVTVALIVVYFGVLGFTANWKASLRVPSLAGGHMCDDLRNKANVGAL